MDKIENCYGIIPARYGSKRFPGKPLSLIMNKPMFKHVFERASQCRELSKVVLATDDPRIESAAKAMNVPVVMTKTDHPSGTDRVLEAAKIIQAPDNSVVVNIQGDEPLLEPVMLSELVRPFSDPAINVTTLARQIDLQEAQSPDCVKVVFATNGKALYFSRSMIPHHRDRPANRFYGHIGLYAFRIKTLKRFVALPPGRLENTEKLEQLRLLENDIPIQVVLTNHKSISVDRPSDIKTVEKILLKYGV